MKKKTLIALGFGLFFAFHVFSQVPKVCEKPNTYVIDSEKPSVYLEFEQFGNADGWGNAKLAEISQKPKIEKGSDIWLRLYNNSCWEITFSTLSMYLSRIPDPANPGKFKPAFGMVEDGNAANVVYVAAEQNGTVVPWGGDVSSMSRLASGASLVFPVYRQHLEKNRSIYVPFNYGWEKDKWSNNWAPEHHSFFWGYRMEEIRKK